MNLDFLIQNNLQIRCAWFDLRAHNMQIEMYVVFNGHQQMHCCETTGFVLEFPQSAYRFTVNSQIVRQIVEC